MTPDGRIVAFIVDEQFDAALRMLRRALAIDGLRVPCEVDTAGRVKQELGVGLKQSIVLYVDDPIRLLEATVMNPAGGLFIPEPVVLCPSVRWSRCSRVICLQDFEERSQTCMRGFWWRFRESATNRHPQAS